MTSNSKNGLIRGKDGKLRCFWPGEHLDYLAYHDDEWGLPVADDHRLFEKISLEGFQSGLSWITILRKRDNFREAFADFDFIRIAKYGERDIKRLLKNAGIVRHRGKIESTINNAKRAREMADEFGSLGAFFWHYEPDASAQLNNLECETLAIPTKTPESIALAKDLKKRSWSFIGPTTAYAFMQGMGMVNDHIEGCCARARAEKVRRRFKRPT